MTLLDTKETKNIHMDNDAMISYAKEIAAQIDEWEKEKKEAEDKIMPHMHDRIHEKSTKSELQARHTMHFAKSL